VEFVVVVHRGIEFELACSFQLKGRLFPILAST